MQAWQVLQEVLDRGRTGDSKLHKQTAPGMGGNTQERRNISLQRDIDGGVGLSFVVMPALQGALITTVVPHLPACLAKMRAGQVVHQVNAVEIDLLHTNQITSLLQGGGGTMVMLTISDGPQQAIGDGTEVVIQSAPPNPVLF